MLEVSGLEAGYGDGRVLFGVDFRVASGEVVTLLGRNGMGKTTTLAAVMGIVRAQAGSIRLDGAVLIVIGFIVAFIAALFVVRRLVDFVSRHGFGVFAWYRIVVGAIALIALALTA